MSVFVTGASGFLGSQIARGLLDEGERVVLLLRGESREEAREKLSGETRDDPRTSICLGALEAPALGLAPEDRERIVAECDRFLHCGASVRFDLPLDQARAVNLGGTLAMLDLARARHRAFGLKRFDHVSTAYVAGRRADLVLESDLDDRAGHKNSYERSKFEAELAVRRAMEEIPATVHRPSIVVGSAEDGRTTSFSMIYWPARMYAQGLWRTCPGNPDAPIDLVPVDFVRNAILSIRRRDESLGKTFHIAAGPDAPTLGQLARIVAAVFGREKPVRFVDPGRWMRFVHPVLKHLSFGRPRRVVRAGEYYVPYFVSNPRFDVRGASDILARSGLPMPRVADYVERLFRYCIETDWGRRRAV